MCLGLSLPDAERGQGRAGRAIVLVVVDVSGRLARVGEFARA